jgi:uncharacterized protein (DUF427 family)
MSSSPAYAHHPEDTITVKPFPGCVVVETKDRRTVVDTRAALEPREAPFDEVADIKEARAFYPNKAVIKARAE